MSWVRCYYNYYNCSAEVELHFLYGWSAAITYIALLDLYVERVCILDGFRVQRVHVVQNSESFLGSLES